MSLILLLTQSLLLGPDQLEPQLSQVNATVNDSNSMPTKKESHLTIYFRSGNSQVTESSSARAKFQKRMLATTHCRTQGFFLEESFFWILFELFLFLWLLWAFWLLLAFWLLWAFWLLLAFGFCCFSWHFGFFWLFGICWLLLAFVGFLVSVVLASIGFLTLLARNYIYIYIRIYI